MERLILPRYNVIDITFFLKDVFSRLKTWDFSLINKKKLISNFSFLIGRNREDVFVLDSVGTVYRIDNVLRFLRKEFFFELNLFRFYLERGGMVILRGSRLHYVLSDVPFDLQLLLKLTPWPDSIIKLYEKKKHFFLDFFQNKIENCSFDDCMSVFSDLLLDKEILIDFFFFRKEEIRRKLAECSFSEMSLEQLSLMDDSYFNVRKEKIATEWEILFHFLDQFFFDLNKKFVSYSKVVFAFPLCGQYAPFSVWNENLRIAVGEKYNEVVEVFQLSSLGSGLVLKQEEIDLIILASVVLPSKREEACLTDFFFGRSLFGSFFPWLEDFFNYLVFREKFYISIIDSYFYFLNQLIGFISIVQSDLFYFNLDSFFVPFAKVVFSNPPCGFYSPFFPYWKYRLKEIVTDESFFSVIQSQKFSDFSGLVLNNSDFFRLLNSISKKTLKTSEQCITSIVQRDDFYFRRGCKTFVPYRLVVLSDPAVGFFAPFKLFWKIKLKETVTEENYNFVMKYMMSHPMVYDCLVLNPSDFSDLISLVNTA